MSVYNHRPSAVNLNQLVTSIPIRRKAADQVEREKFEWSQVEDDFLVDYFLVYELLCLLSVAKCKQGN